MTSPITGERRFPLVPLPMNNGAISVPADARVRFSSSDGPGAGILRSKDLVPWCAEHDLHFPAVLRVQLAVTSGQVYAQVLDRELKVPVSRSASPKDSEPDLYLYLEKPVNGAVLMIGVVDPPTHGELGDVAIAPVQLMDPAEYRQIRASTFPHWYYSCDLGYGVSRTATLREESRATKAARDNLNIMLAMIDKIFPSVQGLTVLDAACSAGLHSFELARRGAIVTGIDWDTAAIEQARFIHECISTELQHPIHFQCADLFAFQAPPKSFDLVYCSGLFYHLQDPIGAARKLAALCRGGTVMHCCVSSREGDLLEISDSQKFPFCASWEFALVPTPSMLKRIMENAGFVVVDMLDYSEFSIEGNTIRELRSHKSSTPSGPVYLALKASR